MYPSLSIWFRMSSWRYLFHCLASHSSPLLLATLAREYGPYLEGLLVMAMRLAHSARVSSDTGFPKYFSAAAPTPSQPAPRGMTFRYHSSVVSLS